MGKLIIGIAVIWGFLLLLGVVLRVLSDTANALGQQWDRTRPVRERVGHMVGHPVGVLAATVQDHRLMSMDIGITLLIAALLLSVADGASIISSIDALGGTDLPLLGWAIAGGIAGIAMGIGSRVLELGGFGAAAVSRVPDMRHLRAGEEATTRYRRVRIFTAVVGAIILLVALAFSQSRTAEYDPRSDIDRKTAAIAAAGTDGKIAALNAALEDAVGRLQTDPKTGVKILVALQGLSRDGARSEVTQLAKIAQKYLTVYQAETEKLVADGKPDALARSEAFSVVDRVASQKWLGRLYEVGKGGANRDRAKALAYYGEAALVGDKNAETMRDKLVHSMVLSQDDGTRQAVFAFLEQKAQTGGPSDHYWLGEWYARAEKPEGLKGAEKWLGKALAQDADLAAKGMAFTSLSGLEGVGSAATRALDEAAPKYVKGKDEKMKKAAYAYLEKLANSGDQRSAMWMGFRFAQGDGVAKDQEKAADWFLTAALQGKHAVVQDRVFAAIDAEVKEAFVRVLDEQAPKRVRGKDEKMKRAAYVYLEERANSGDPGSALWMGFRYMEGDGVGRDEEKARHWILKAVLQDKDLAVKERAYASLGELQKRSISGLGSQTSAESGATSQTLSDRGPSAASRAMQDPAHGQTPKSETQASRPLIPDATKQKGDSTNKTILIPANASHQYSAQGWACNFGYRQDGSACEYIQKPANASHQYSAQGWACNFGYRQDGSACEYIQKPANASHQYSAQGWACNFGYRQVGSECWKVEVSK